MRASPVPTRARLDAGQRGLDSRNGPSRFGGNGRSWLALPVALVALLFLVATTSQGAFAARLWAPPTIFALLVLAAAVAGGARVAPGNRAVRLAVAAVWAFCAWGAASAAWSTSPGMALEGAGRAICYAAVFTIPILLTPRGRGLSFVRGVVVAGLGAIAVIVLVRLYIDGTSVFLAGRLNAPIDYRNASASLFAFIFWPLIVYAAPRSAPRGMRAAAFSIATLSLGLAFLTQSRGALVGLVVGGAVALLCGPDRLRRAWLALLAAAAIAAASPELLVPYRAFDAGRGVVTSGDIRHAGIALTLVALAALAVGFCIALFDGGMRHTSHSRLVLRRTLTAALVVAVLGVVVAALVATGNPISYAKSKVDEFRSLAPSTPTSERLTSTGGQRYDLWRVALNEFADHPLNGVGMGNYQFGYYAERRTDRNLSDAHSLLFGLLAETGIVGVALFVLFVASATAAIASRWRRLSPALRTSTAALVSGAAVILGQSLVDWEWLVPGIMGLALFVLGLAVGQVVHAENSPAAEPSLETTSPPAGWRIAAPRAIATVALSLAAIAITCLFISDFYVRRARAADTAGEAAQRLTAARMAGKFDPFSVTPLYLQAGALESEGQRAAASARLQDARDLEPGNFVPLGLLGDFEVRAGRPAVARAYYRRAVTLNPRDVGLQHLAAGRFGR